MKFVMKYDGDGRRISKAMLGKLTGAAEWSVERATHYTGVGTEIRTSNSGNADETKVMSFMKISFYFLMLLPLNLYAECNLFIHHKVYGSFGRACFEPPLTYADSIIRGEDRVQQRGYTAKWYKYEIPDSLCQTTFNDNLGKMVDETFCLRFVGLLEFDNQYVFIHRFSDFYDHTQKKLFPIKQVPELKNYLMEIEYFRENYREMK